MKKLMYLCSCVFVCSLMLFGNPASNQALASDKVVNGVYIDQVDISGMTKEEAKAAVEAFVAELGQKGVAVMVDDEIVYGTVSDMGLTYDYGDCLDEAIGLGKTGNLIKRYKDLKDISHGNVVYPLKLSVSLDKIKEFVGVECAAYDIAPINASLKREGGKFVYTSHKVGRKIVVDETSEIIFNKLNENWDRMDLVVEAVVVDDQPLYLIDDVQKCNAIIGSYSTNYKTSSSNRSGNLTNGARLINGTVLYPGETFSAYEKLAPIDTSNGYFMAGAYSSGKVIDSVGGGVCQVSTTLYNAVLFAELEIVQRQEHSMSVSYVPLSRDAAIAGTYKDLKFKNNTNAPIYIEAFTRNKEIFFNIWGAETRPANRTIKFETVELLKEQPPKDVITKDKTKPTSYYKVTQSAHYGYKTELYKVIYIDGIEAERVLINKSSYQKAPAYITIGTKVEKPEQDKVDKDEDKDKVDVNDDLKEENETSNKVEQDKKPGKPEMEESNDEIIGEEE